MVEKVWLALRATAFPLFCTVAGASGVYVLGGGKKRGGEQVMNGFAAGVMLAASFFSLLVPAVQGAASWHAPTLGFALGVAGLAAAEAGAAALGHAAHSSCRAAMAIALHNLPEGMIIGAAYASPLSVNLWSGSGLIMAVIIGMHNVPEGMAVSVPLIAGGMKKGRAVFCTAMSGAPTILGALLGYWLGTMGQLWHTLALCFASGAMLYVVFGELLPEAILMWRSKLPAAAVLAGMLCGICLLFI